MIRGSFRHTYLDVSARAIYERGTKANVGLANEHCGFKETPSKLKAFVKVIVVTFGLFLCEHRQDRIRKIDRRLFWPFLAKIKKDQPSDWSTMAINAS